MKLVDNTLYYTASDLSNFLGCKHLTELDRNVALGKLAPSDSVNPSLALLQEKGQEHEDAYVAELKDSGLDVLELKERSIEATIRAMKNGHDVITQATLLIGHWTGRADILKRVTGKSDLGEWYYEIEDTKLARETKASTVLQLCLYTEILGKIQNKIPEVMRVVKPGDDFPKEEFRFDNYEAYYRFVKSQFEKVIEADPLDTYPFPVAKCNTCHWWKNCDKRWHDDDHLSLIAGIGSNHIKELERQEFKTLKSYAEFSLPLKESPESGGETTYLKYHNQAKIQLEGRHKGELLNKALEVEPLRGLNRLPEPTKDDLYFDIEGDHFYEEGGLEYLLGFIFYDQNSTQEYQGIWAKSRKEEKQAFEAFMSLVMEKWDNNPGMHIYHYAPYEPSAIKRLASRHSSYQEEVDRLLRADRFVDLYSVVKESLIASVESYSLKDIEKLGGFERTADLRLASAARRDIAVALDFDDFESLADTQIPLVEEYNKDDCLATEALHKWLEDFREQQVAEGEKFTRPVDIDGKSSDSIAELDGQALELYHGLVSNLSDDPESWSEDEKAIWLLAHQIDFFRRENKSSWWEFFRLNDMEEYDLYNERKGIAGLKFIETIEESRGIKTDRYSFPSQEIAFESGKKLVIPKDENAPQGKFTVIGSVADIAYEQGTIDIKKTKKTNDIHSTCLHVDDTVSPGVLIPSLFSFAQNIIVNGIDGEGLYRAGRDLLLKKPPRLKQSVEFSRVDNETTEEFALRMALELDNGILPIQGPPGTGKTYLGGGLVSELVKAGKKVGVTAISHKVIRNMLDQIKERAVEKNINLNIKHKPKSGTTIPKDDPVLIKTTKDAIEELDKLSVVGGVGWLWADNAMEGKLDYLFVDEAGQMSLTMVLAISRAAKNIVLLGDPQQLEQPTKGAHPEGTDISALNHILDGSVTIKDNKGIFLDTTWRLNTSINEYISKLYYEGRLNAKEGLDNQTVSGNSPFIGGGLFYCPVEHEKNKGQSHEEVLVIDKLVKHLLSAQLTWKNRAGEESLITHEDILIVAPYNAQVSALKSRLPNLRIGTVDKFQGQQAPVVIYSMTSSTPEEAPRGMNFLFNPNRMNVAISRAQCISILVSSPNLFEANCNTVDQMKWANGLCTYQEMAQVIQKF